MRPERIHKKNNDNGDVVLTVIEFENSDKVLVSYPNGKEYMCSKAAGREMWAKA